MKFTRSVPVLSFTKDTHNVSSSTFPPLVHMSQGLWQRQVDDMLRTGHKIFQSSLWNPFGLEVGSIANPLSVRLNLVFSSFASAVIKLQISRRFKFDSHGVDKDERSDSSRYYIGQLGKESMLNLGPTFVKVGQSLSTRPDIIGSEISKALFELHDKVPPFPRAMAVKVIEEEFRCPLEKIFSYISEEPVAAASFGQVYRCCTLDGCVVAVKVQRPNLLHAVVRDM